MSLGPAPSSRLFCTFRLADRRYGIDVLDVKEVAVPTAFTPVAHAPEQVVGLVNIRGQIHLALDLRRMLGLPATVIGPDTRLVLFKPAVGTTFGVVVDAIGPIQAVAADRVEAYTSSGPRSSPADAGPGLIEGVCQLEDELLIVLHARCFLAAIDAGPSVTP